MQFLTPCRRVTHGDLTCSATEANPLREGCETRDGLRVQTDGAPKYFRRPVVISRNACPFAFLSSVARNPVRRLRRWRRRRRLDERIFCREICRIDLISRDPLGILFFSLPRRLSAEFLGQRRLFALCTPTSGVRPYRRTRWLRSIPAKRDGVSVSPA